jgi:hypothetical protein
MKKPPRDGIIPADRKMVVTEYSLDHWLAQSFKLNLESIPPVRPSHIPVTFLNILILFAEICLRVTEKICQVWKCQLRCSAAIVIVGSKVAEVSYEQAEDSSC